jgi:hypothetical protein
MGFGLSLHSVRTFGVFDFLGLATALLWDFQFPSDNELTQTNLGTPFSQRISIFLWKILSFFLKK